MYELSARPDSADIADVSGDGRADLLATASYGDPPDLGKLLIFVQLPDGSLAAPLRRSGFGGSSVFDPATGDLNGDGAADVVVTSQSGLEVFYQEDGGLGEPIRISNTGWLERPKVADVDLDGLNDIVAGGIYGTALMRNDGVGFTRITVTDDTHLDRDVGDVTGDGLPDLVGFNLDTIEVYAQIPGGSWAAPVAYEPRGGGAGELRRGGRGGRSSRATAGATSRFRRQASRSFRNARTGHWGCRSCIRPPAPRVRSSPSTPTATRFRDIVTAGWTYDDGLSVYLQSEGGGLELERRFPRSRRI